MKTWNGLLAFVFCVSSAYADESPTDLAPHALHVFAERLSPEKLWSRGISSGEPIQFDDEIAIVRGQTPTFDNGSGGTSPFYDGEAPIYQGGPNAMQYSQPVIPAQPGFVDPFMNPQAGLGAPPVQVFPGVNGPQPYRYGWTLRSEFEYQAGTNATLGGVNLGDVEIYGLNIEAQNAMPLGYGGGWVFINTPNFGYRVVNGPDNVGPPFAVDDLYSFGWDFKLVTPAIAGWGAEVAFEPTIATDMSSSIDTSLGVNWDGRGALYWQWGPQWTWVGGVMYWDRVEDRVLPYGGAIWNPNPLWEFRIMYPESQVKVFMGNYWGWSHWLYARAEFHSEAYQVEPLPGLETQLQIDDWRAAIGWQFDNGIMAGFAEAGWIFDREVLFRAAPGTTIDLDSGLLVRAGLRF